ncbi:cell division protein FtsQ/DivIB [Rhodoligotrophos ferricapiens]|uniref:cell division protein FtsQ/DivIB n=1 Tax=Rhodoligotrophos ferricapiens TaxID=3069264 RepID=UPI00315D4F7C
MGKVSASDWIRRSAEYPTDGALALLPPRVKTIRAGSAQAAKPKLPPVAAAAGLASATQPSAPDLPPVAKAAKSEKFDVAPTFLRSGVGLPPVAAAASSNPGDASPGSRDMRAPAVTPDLGTPSGEPKLAAKDGPRLPPAAAAAGKSGQGNIGAGDIPSVVSPVREPALTTSKEAPRLPPVAAAAGKASMASTEPPVAAAAGGATRTSRPSELRAERAREPEASPRAKTRMEALVEPRPAPAKISRPQFEPLPVQLPSHELVTKVTRQRRTDPRERARGRLIGDIAPATFLLVSLIVSLVMGGHFEERGGSLRGLVNATASLIGLSADDVRITGLDQQTPEQVLAAIGVEQGGSLIGFDANEARKKLEQLDWISHASVLRLFPNKLLIDLTERHPFALWQSDGVFKVVDKSGIPMPSLEVRAYRNLPIVVGEGANLAALDLVNHLEAQPDIMSLTRAAVRVADRRWVLYLHNSIKVDLPEEQIDEALVLLKTLIDRYGIMTRDIVNIDMRLHDRVVVRMSDEAAEKLKAQEKTSKPVKVSQSQ